MQPTQKHQRFSISSISIRRHIATLMLIVAVVVMGGFFIIKLPVDLLPSITYPRIGIRIDAPGISPEVAVDEITKPLESAFAAAEGVLQVFSQTREGSISLDLYFRPGGNIDQALNDTTAAFNRARNRLPENIETPRIFKFEPSQLPVYEFALTSPSLSTTDLRVFADEELARELSILPGVASVNVSGGLKEEVKINLDSERLQALGIGLTDILELLRNRNQDISGGRLLGEDSEALTRTVGRFQNIAEIKNLSFPVTSPTLSTARIYLRDFAEIIDGTEKERIYVLLNGQPAVKLSIQKQPDANTVNVVDAIKHRLAQLESSNLFPQGTILTATLDESRFIRNSISNVVTAGLTGTALAAVAVLLFLGSWRQTFIIVIAIPLASLAAIILMGIFGLSLNVFSLGGLALGVGIVVDNSIVMLEHIAQGAGITPGKGSKTRLQPHELIEQAEASSHEVESALIASTSTNLVAVVPFLLIGGFISLLFNELILTISFSIASSILIAVTIVPMLTSRTLAWKFSSGLNRFWLFTEFNRRFYAATNTYSRLLGVILRWRFFTIITTIILFGGTSLWMAPQIPQELLPPISTGQVRLNAQFPPGTTLETNRQVMDMVDDILLQQPETEYAFSTSGGSLFGTNVSANPLRGTSTITLEPGTNVDEYIKKVTEDLNKLNLVGIRLRLIPGQVRGLILSNSPVNSADVDVIIQGTDTRALEKAGATVLTALEEQATLLRFRPDADAPQPELRIIPDWERAANLGLNTKSIGEIIQTAIEGTVATRLERDNRLVDVRVQLNSESISNVAELERLPVFTSNGFIPLMDVAKIVSGEAPGEIQRLNQRQVVIIAGNLNEGANLSDALEQVNTVIESIDLPPGVSLLPSFTSASNQEVQNSLGLLAGLAIFLVFVVMAVQYNSLVDPLVIMFTIPLSLAGGIFGLYLTSTAIGATVMVGAVLLVGIVVNNAILMVELANQIREKYSVDRKTAILQAAPQRLRPVLMTTITTVLGMLPLAMGVGEGSEFLQPLGVVVFSGLSLATLLTLFIIPCFYTLLHDMFSGGCLKSVFIYLDKWNQNIIR